MPHAERGRGPRSRAAMANVSIDIRRGRAQHGQESVNAPGGRRFVFKSFIAAVARVAVMCGAVACVAGPMPAPTASLPHAASPSEDVVAAATALLGRPDLSGRASLSSTMSWGSKVRVVDATFEFAGDAQYER